MIKQNPQHVYSHLKIKFSYPAYFKECSLKHPTFEYFFLLHSLVFTRFNIRENSPCKRPTTEAACFLLWKAYTVKAASKDDVATLEGARRVL